ncbi:MAG: hypothetical protein ACQEUO_18240 [Bacillota bacterium]
MTKIEEVSLIKNEHPLCYEKTVICFKDKCLDDKFEFKKGVIYEFFSKRIESKYEKFHYYFKEYGNDSLYEIDRRQNSILTDDFYYNTEMRNLSNNEYIQKNSI